MRHLTTSFIHSIKDQVRGVRYSIRAEADAPGSALPKVLRDAGLRPLIAIGSVVSSPALRIADGVLTQVESVTTDMLQVVTGRPERTPFPHPIGAYLQTPAGTTGVDFAETLYGTLTQALQGYGARNMLVSEHALDAAWASFRQRDGDLAAKAIAASPVGEQRALVRLCAGMTVALVEARPIKRVEFADGVQVRPRHLLLSPNHYCALVAGLATAIITIKPETMDDPAAVLESADAAVDARFGRFKEALDGKDPAGVLTERFQAILPFLP